MTKRGLIISILQLIGVYLACDVVARAMSFTVFSGTGNGEMSADWTQIWAFNLVFWAVGLAFSILLIFFAAPVATFLSRISKTDDDSEITFGAVTSEIFVQVSASFLLIRQSYYLVFELLSLLQFQSFDVVRFLVFLIYFAATIGAAIALLRSPALLRRLLRSPSRKTEAEQGGAHQPVTASDSKSEGDEKPKQESEGNSR
ncbi:MAG: multisubunit Na+/H+ antiporter MnhG subunit [Akkermansiaceae bacterium]|jgi:multisubunit Na+/H+ antiporter MnhG subunit